MKRVTIRSNGCWIFNGPKNRDGYGIVSLGKRGAQERAHRVIYSLMVGEIPRNMGVLHRCDTPACINPDHLFVGFQADNNRDMVQKGRAHGSPGSKHPKARLDEWRVQCIRALARCGARRTQLARLFKVTPTNIGHILSRKLWRHVA